MIKRFVGCVMISVIGYICMGGQHYIANGVDWEYDNDDGGVTILSAEILPESDGRVRIPSEIEGCEVKRIGDSAFYNLDNLFALVFPASIETISRNAVRSCCGLSCVYFLGDAPQAEESSFSSLHGYDIAFYVSEDSNGWNDWPYGNCFRFCKTQKIVEENQLIDGGWARIDDAEGLRYGKSSEHYYYGRYGNKNNCKTECWLSLHEDMIGYLNLECRCVGFEPGDSLSCRISDSQTQDSESCSVVGVNAGEWVKLRIPVFGDVQIVVDFLHNGYAEDKSLEVRNLVLEPSSNIVEDTSWLVNINDAPVPYWEDDRYSGGVKFEIQLPELSMLRKVSYWVLANSDGEYSYTYDGTSHVWAAPTCLSEVLYGRGDEHGGWWLSANISFWWGETTFSYDTDTYDPPTHSHYTIELDPGEHGSFDGWTGDPYRSGSYCWRLEPGDFLSAESLMHIDPGYRIAGWELVNYDWYEIGYSSFSWCTVGYGTLYYRAQYAPIVNTVTYVDTFGLENPNPPEYSLELELLPLRGMRKGFRFAGWDVKHGPEREVQNDYRVYVDQWYNEDLVCSYYWTDGDLVATAMWEPAIAFGDAVGDAWRGWIKDGDADWFTVWSEDKEAWCVRSGEICDGQTSTLETVVTNGGTVSFEVKVSCEGIQRGKRTDGLMRCSPSPATAIVTFVQPTSPSNQSFSAPSTRIIKPSVRFPR